MLKNQNDTQNSDGMQNSNGVRIGFGAEAIVTRTNEGILKDRPKKTYRHPVLDERLRTSRTKTEARLLEKAASAGIPVPKVLSAKQTSLLLTDVPGVAVKEVLDSKPILAHEVGRLVARLHNLGIIHADLTTSNMLYDKDSNRITLIDFGLSYSSIREEDKAVDLHLFKQSLESKHHKVLSLAYRHFLKGYRDNCKDADAVITRLRKVEQRGRNKGS